MVSFPNIVVILIVQGVFIYQMQRVAMMGVRVFNFLDLDQEN
jgi:hypothetical protein